MAMRVSGMAMVVPPGKATLASHGQYEGHRFGDVSVTAYLKEFYPG